MCLASDWNLLESISKTLDIRTSVRRRPVDKSKWTILACVERRGPGGCGLRSSPAIVASSGSRVWDAFPNGDVFPIGQVAQGNAVKRRVALNFAVFDADCSVV
jgi:hypothetical protein